MSKEKKELRSILHRCFYRYVFHRFLQDVSSIIVTMGLLALGVVVALRYTEILGIARIAYPKGAIIYFGIMVVITASVYATWKIIFHRPTMREIVHKIDSEAAMQQQLLYCYELQHNRDDLVLQYIAQHVHDKCDEWQHYPRTTITKSFVRPAILTVVWVAALWMLFISPATAFTNTKEIAHNNAKAKAKTQTKPKQKKQQQKKQQQRKQQQKKQQQKQNKNKQQQKKTPQKSKKPQQKKPQKNSPQNKNQRPQGGKGKGKKKNNKNGKQLPQAKPKQEQISSLFSQGDDVDLKANVGTSNKGDLSDIEMFHRNLKQLPIYFQKQFLSPEDKMAIKRYFNMIRPSRNSKTQE